jgi:hypothetical protein
MDSFAAIVYRVAPDGPTVVWLHDPTVLGGTQTTACGTFPGGAFGAHGLGFTNEGDLIVVNMIHGLVVGMPVSPDGRPGAPAVVAGPTCAL